MGRKRSHSLLLHVGILMAIIIVLAISSMMSSVWIGKTIQGETRAVNIAGSLRMQSYRIATQLLSLTEFDEEIHWQKMQGLVQSFEARLKGRPLLTILSYRQEHAVRRAYEKVNHHWKTRIRPLLNIYIEGIIPPVKKPETAPKNWGMISEQSVTGLRAQYLSRMPYFVELIDQFVKSLEEDTENRIQELRNWQWIAFILTIALVLFALWFIKRNIVKPLHHLLTCTQTIGQGNFSARTSYTEHNELGDLGRTFNEMSETLSRLYNDLEERVRIKTADLECSNRSLEVLYRTVNRLSGTTFPHATYQVMLEDIATLAGTGPAVICLSNTLKEKAYKIASTRPKNDPLTACKAKNCHKCFGSGTIHHFEQTGAGQQSLDVISIPITNAHKQHGVLLVQTKEKEGFEPWQRKMLEAVANHIAIAITMSSRQAEQSRLALLEERSAIARELHDSLAQSLSYAKIQVSRLDCVLRKEESTHKTKLEAASRINDELRDGLNRAYRELRELLTTFRLTMDHHNLSIAIRETVGGFEGRNGLEIDVETDYPEGLLTPNEEIHILQIVREALSNIVQHSRADHALITLNRSEDGHIALSISDNGVGMQQSPTDRKRQHYGLVIMRERIASLNGTLSIRNNPTDKSGSAGTGLLFSFLPLAQKSAIKADPLPPVQNYQTKENVVL